jgi:elongation factor P
MVVTDLRAGTTFEEEGNIYVVLSYEHIKMGRGSANIKVKVRNIKSGATTERSFINGAQVNEIVLEKKELQFLYKDDSLVYFMNPTTFEQITVPIAKLAGNEYLIEGENVMVQFYDEEPLSLLLPPKVTMKIADTPPGVRGDSTSNVYKYATLENVMKVRVPLFINTGDDVVVDTRDGSYTKRA